MRVAPGIAGGDGIATRLAIVGYANSHLFQPGGRRQ